MPTGRHKYNYYAVLNGRETGVFTTWPQASNSVVGYAKSKYKGFIRYAEAKTAMEKSGIYNFNVYDGKETVSNIEYEKRLTSVCEGYERGSSDNQVVSDEVNMNKNISEDVIIVSSPNTKPMSSNENSENISNISNQEECTGKSTPKVANGSEITNVTVKERKTTKPKKVKDNSNTPVPGSINGSLLNNKTPVRKINDTFDNQPKYEPKLDNGQILSVMKNMETIMEMVLLELNTSREDNFKFKEDVKRELTNLNNNQMKLSETICTALQDARSDAKLTSESKSDKELSEKINEITRKQHNMIESVQKINRDINDRFDGLKSPLKSIERISSDIKASVSTISKSNSDFYGVTNLSQKQILDTVTSTGNEMKKSREVMVEMEKGISVIADLDSFSRSRLKMNIDNIDLKSPKSLAPVKEIQNEKTTSYIENNQHDDEMTYVKVVTPCVSTNQNSDACTPVREENSDKQEPPQENKGKKSVFLVGDSIIGQINVPSLGRSSKSFVRRMKAPKICDIKKATDNVKNADLIIIHTGINNFRDNEDSEQCIKSCIDEIGSVKEKCPNAKVMISKIIPVGNKELGIESALFNATVEKKISEKHKDIDFIDHSNLGFQGTPIQDYYRRDLIHLSSRGVNKLHDNIRYAIENWLEGSRLQARGGNDGVADKSDRSGENPRVRGRWYKRDGTFDTPKRNYETSNFRYKPRTNYKRHYRVHYHHRERDEYDRSRRDERGNDAVDKYDNHMRYERRRNQRYYGNN